MKGLFLVSLVICVVLTCLYFNNIVSYDFAMPIIVTCIGIMTLDKAIQAYQIKNKRAFGIFGFAVVFCFAFVAAELLGII